MKYAIGAVMIITGMIASPAAFAGQLNALGQWVPTSTEEGRKGWTVAGPIEEIGKSTQVATRAQAAAVGGELAGQHPALAPFSVGGR